MKKIITFGLLFVTLITINSCAKNKGCTDSSAPNFNSTAQEDDGSCKDIPTQSGILGIYTGSIQDSTSAGSAVITGQQISITKIDDSHIQVSSYNGGQLYNFTAQISVGASGYLLSIPAQNSDGTPLAGSPLATSGGSIYNGSFLPSTNQFASATTFDVSGNTFIEYYVGTHQ